MRAKHRYGGSGRQPYMGIMGREPTERSIAMVSSSSYYGARSGATIRCLGQPPHPLTEQEPICSICGTLAAGAQLGIYQVQQLLGQGRNGKAYLAVHLRSRQPVVVKLFAPNPATIGLWEAARREVRSITTLQHNNLLPVYSCTLWSPENNTMNNQPLNEQMLAYAGRAHYLLTLCQYAPSSLPQLIAHYERSENKSGTDPGGALLVRLLYLIKQAGEALSALHQRNLAHGAVTPGNLLLASQERLLLADSGLARLQPPPPPYLAPELQTLSTRCVQAGNMSALWNAANPASDQYMLAVLCQQLFSRLLQADDYKHLQPVLQAATNQQVTRRFATIDIFIHELMALGTRSRPFPASNYSTSTTTGGMRQVTSGLHSQPFPTTQPMPLPTARPTTQPMSLPTANPATEQNWYEQMLVYHPSTMSPNSEEDWEKLGGKQFTARNYEAALKSYLRALELQNGKPTLWLALGDTYFALEHYAESLKAYEQAVTLNPDDATAWNNRGTALDALGRRREALQCYERAEQLDPV